jgi:DNA-directed RNA polymerase beta subunit
MKGVNEQGQPSMVELLKPALDENGSVVLENDLSESMMDVVSNVGPSFATQRAATRRTLLGMMQFAQDPQMQKILLATLLQNLDGDGVKDVAEYMRKEMVMAGVMKPTQEEAQMLSQAAQNQKPDPQTVLAEAMAQEAVAKAGKAQADSVSAIAGAELKRAQAAQAMASIGTDRERLLAEQARTVADLLRPPGR